MCMFSLFIYIWHIRKEVFKPRQPLPGMANRVWLETTLTTAQAQLCIWLRCSYCPKGWGLSCHGWDPAAQGHGSARTPQALGHPHQQHRGHCCHHLTRLSEIQNSSWHSRSQSGSCSLSPCVLPRMLSCPQPEEGWYPHQDTQFSHTSHLSSFPSAWHWKDCRSRRTPPSGFNFRTTLTQSCNVMLPDQSEMVI